VTGIDPLTSAYTDVQAKMAEIEKETDPILKGRGLVQLDQMVGTFGADVVSKTRKEAELQFNVPLLRKNLEAMEMKDRQHPMWQQYLTDSQETTAVRRTLMDAEQKVETYAQRLIKEHRPLNALNSSVQTFKAIQGRLLEREITRNEVANDKAEAIVSGLSPDVKEALFSARPDLAGNKIGLATFLTTELSKNRKDWEPILSGTLTDNDYVSQAAVGNRAAAFVLAHKQAKLSGQDVKEAQGDIRMLQDFVNNPLRGTEIFNKLPYISKEEKDAYRKFAQSPNPKDQQEAAKVRAVYAPFILRDQLTARATDIRRTPLYTLPEVQETMKKFETASGRMPTTQEFFNAFVNKRELTPEQKTARHQMVTGALTTSIRNANKNAYGIVIDEAGIVNTLKVRNVMTTFGQAVADDWFR